MAALPPLVCLKSVSNNKFLRYRNEQDQAHGLVEFAGESVMDPYNQFEVVNSKKRYDLVHLKCRYTNLFLVRWLPNHNWISASAYIPNEDQSSWACTLFKPIVVEDSGDAKKIRLLHVQLGYYVRLQNDARAPFDSCLSLFSKDPDHQNSLDLLSVVDWQSIFKIPKRVALKVIDNQYLGAHTFEGQPGVKFAYNDPKDPKVAHQMITSSDGTIYIKSEYYGKFWRVGNNNWIVVDGDGPESANNRDAMFRLSALGGNGFTLMNMTKDSYIKRFTHYGLGRESSLAAVSQSIDEWARFEVIDLDK